MDRRAVNAILAIVGLKKSELAERTGYGSTYVRQVLAGISPVAGEFRDKFWAEIDKEVFGARGGRRVR